DILLDMRLSKQNIKKISQYFKQKPVLKAYLFGSQATGEATKSSDVDILVELDYTQKIGLLFVQMQLDLEDILNRKVDLVSHKGISKYIKANVEKNKQLIYVR
ncbi:MAG: nucleotidyltransferase domain-containing protein, partial [Bacteroidota bacterium]